MKNFFPGITPGDLPGGLGWAVEFLTLTTHSGTHLDAPYHYSPTMDQGKPSMRSGKSFSHRAAPWIYGLLLPGEDQAGQRRLDSTHRYS